MEQIKLPFHRRSAVAPVELQPSADEQATRFLEAIQERVGEQPSALFGASMTLPTVLYFPSGRGIQRAPVAPAHDYAGQTCSVTAPHDSSASTGDTWAASIENLFVWLTWLDPELEKQCREHVNEIVFRGTKRIATIDRQNLEVVVETVTGERHRLDQLSSGERQLVQLVVRIAAHMTSFYNRSNRRS